MSKGCFHACMSGASSIVMLFVAVVIGNHASTESYVIEVVGSLSSEVLVAVTACFLGSVINSKKREANIVLVCLLLTYVVGSFFGAMDDEFNDGWLVYCFASVYFFCIFMSFLTLERAIFSQ
ncbi:hypothetical protein KUW00_05795 [Halomonas sp. DP5N14-9]|uniref:hypothetical protein n=1 Tax=Halomonas sp. DP5N14-9 TaxID=2859075 RepID=UPI001C9904CC|nr:hypothetical protein [Halomonas sp. DP5N14-9]MBY5940399.1 hypothetical protein [Halomonas sp. DP5N14-9]